MDWLLELLGKQVECKKWSSILQTTTTIKGIVTRVSMDYIGLVGCHSFYRVFVKEFISEKIWQFVESEFKSKGSLKLIPGEDSPEDIILKIEHDI